jgi:hypothetical protein
LLSFCCDLGERFFFFLASSVAVERFSTSWCKMAPFSAAVTSFRVECFDFDTLEIWCDEGLTAGDMMEQLGHSSLCASSRQMGGRTVRPRLERVAGVGMKFPPRPSNDFPEAVLGLVGQSGGYQSGQQTGHNERLHQSGCAPPPDQWGGRAVRPCQTGARRQLTSRSRRRWLRPERRLRPTAKGG